MFFTRKATEETASHPTALMRNVFGASAARGRQHAAVGPTFRVSDRLHKDRAVTVAAGEIAATVAGWLAELGVHSPLVDQLAAAVGIGDWTTARAIADHLSVDFTSTL